MSLLGWCMTGHHGRCPGAAKSVNGKRRILCSCSCHGGAA